MALFDSRPPPPTISPQRTPEMLTRSDFRPPPGVGTGVGIGQIVRSVPLLVRSNP